MISISLITPTFNRAHTLFRLFKSIESQNYTFLEWIIIDDGSTDNTRTVIERIKEQSSIDIRYFYQNNGGKSSAVNMALNYVSYEYVGIIDSDDEIFPDALSNLDFSVTTSPKSAISFIGYCNTVNKIIPRGLYSWDELIKLCHFEMWGIHLTSHLKNIDFQPYKDEKFYPEYNVWSEINNLKNAYFTGHILRFYHQDNEGLSSSFIKLAIKNPKGYLDYFKKKSKSEIAYFKRFKYRLYVLIFNIYRWF